MTWAKLLADIDGGAGGEAVVGAALRIGQAFAARVELLHVEVSEEQAIPIVAEGMTAGAVGQMLESLIEQREIRAEAAETLYQTLCVDAGLATCEPDDAAASALISRCSLRLSSICPTAPAVIPSATIGIACSSDTSTCSSSTRAAKA